MLPAISKLGDSTKVKLLHKWKTRKHTHTQEKKKLSREWKRKEKTFIFYALQKKKKKH